MNIDLNTVGSIASILSLVVSIFVISKVIKIDKSINNSTDAKIKGNKNIVSGRDTKVK